MEGIVLVPLGVLLVVGALVLPGRERVPTALRVVVVVLSGVAVALATVAAVVLYVIGACGFFGTGCTEGYATVALLIGLGGLGATIALVAWGARSIRRHPHPSAEPAEPAAVTFDP